MSTKQVYFHSPHFSNKLHDVTHTYVYDVILNFHYTYSKTLRSRCSYIKLINNKLLMQKSRKKRTGNKYTNKQKKQNRKYTNSDREWW